MRNPELSWGGYIFGPAKPTHINTYTHKKSGTEYSAPLLHSFLEIQNRQYTAIPDF